MPAALASFALAAFALAAFVARVFASLHTQPPPHPPRLLPRYTVPGFRRAANDRFSRDSTSLPGGVRWWPLFSSASHAQIDKRWAWLVGWGLGLPVGFVMLACLGKGQVLPFGAGVGYLGVMVGGSRYLFRAIRADLIDYDQFLVGVRREAQLIMYLELLPRWASIPLHAAVFGVLQAGGYSPGAATQPPRVVTLLSFFCLLLPTVLALLGWAIALFYPIDDLTHDGVVRSISVSSHS